MCQGFDLRDTLSDHDLLTLGISQSESYGATRSLYHFIKHGARFEITKLQSENAKLHVEIVPLKEKEELWDGAQSKITGLQDQVKRFEEKEELTQAEMTNLRSEVKRLKEKEAHWDYAQTEITNLRNEVKRCKEKEELSQAENISLQDENKRLNEKGEQYLAIQDNSQQHHIAIQQLEKRHQACAQVKDEYKAQRNEFRDVLLANNQILVELFGLPPTTIQASITGFLAYMAEHGLQS